MTAVQTALDFKRAPRFRAGKEECVDAIAIQAAAP